MKSQKKKHKQYYLYLYYICCCTTDVVISFLEIHIHDRSWSGYDVSYLGYYANTQPIYAVVRLRVMFACVTLVIIIM